MPRLSRWIFAYGLLLIALQLVDEFGWLSIGLVSHTRVSGWTGGALMMAAGLASAQGRRSLRLGGIWVATFLALALAGLFAWDAAQIWRGGAFNRSEACAISGLALASMALVWIIAHLRPREGIASRGYSVPLTSGRGGVDGEPGLHEQPKRSQVG